MHVDAVRAASTRSSRGTSRRCRGSAGPAGRRRRARCSTCPSRRVRRWRRRPCCHGGRSCCGLPADLGVSSTQRAAYRWVVHPRISERRQQVLGAASLDHAARPGRLARPGSWSMWTSSMLTPISPASANSRASSPGWSGTDDEDRRASAAPGRRACRGWPGCRRRRGRGSRRAGARSPSATRVDAARRASVADLARAAPSTAVGVGGDDLLPQRRVAGGDPGDVAHALPGEREVLGGARRPAGRRRATASRCGRCEVRATARSCSSGRQPHRRRRRTAAASASTSATAAGSDAVVRGDRPGPAVEQRGARGQRAGPLAAGHRVAADVARRASGAGGPRPRRAGRP